MVNNGKGRQLSAPRHWYLLAKLYSITQRKIVNLRLLIGYINYIRFKIRALFLWLPVKQLHIFHEPKQVTPCVGNLTIQNSYVWISHWRLSIESFLHIKYSKILTMTQRSTSLIGHDSLNSGPSEGRKYNATFRQSRDRAALLSAVVGVRFQITWNLRSKKWHCGGFSSVSPANSHSTNCSTFMNHRIIQGYIVSTRVYLFLLLPQGIREMLRFTSVS
jgi:hypothetical protein